MRIAGTQYTLMSKALEIYFSGCTLHCKNCHNPELWDFEVGEEVTDEYIETLVKKISIHELMIKEIRILGGEPLDQDYPALRHFIDYLQYKFPHIKLVLFTGYDLEDIDPWCFEYFDEIKYGKYDESLPTDEGKFLASSNQKFWRKYDG